MRAYVAAEALIVTVGVAVAGESTVEGAVVGASIVEVAAVEEWIERTCTAAEASTAKVHAVAEASSAVVEAPETGLDYAKE